MLLGINYDTGFFRDGMSTHEPFAASDVAADMAMIKHQLHLDAVRITGGDPDRMQLAAESAHRAGLEVWWCPFLCDVTAAEATAMMVDCARRAEVLRRAGATVTYLVGAELSLFVGGFLPGRGFEERSRFLVDGGAERGPVLAALPALFNLFLAELATRCRAEFTGPLGYCSLPFEGVDWTPFDLIATDAGYRSEESDEQFKHGLTALRQGDKPIAITEFGCCTYTGAARKGGHGADVITWEGPVPRYITGALTRNEQEQAQYITTQLKVFHDTHIDAAFVYTFANFHLPRHDPPHSDLDLASAGVVAVVPNPAGSMRRQPKQAFHHLSDIGQRRQRREPGIA